MYERRDRIKKAGRGKEMLRLGGEERGNQRISGTLKQADVVRCAVKKRERCDKTG